MPALGGPGRGDDFKQQEGAKGDETCGFLLFLNLRSTAMK